MCRWLKSQGTGDMVDTRCRVGTTPRHRAIEGHKEETATACWTMANCRDVNVIDDAEIMTSACSARTTSAAFMQVLASADRLPQAQEYLDAPTRHPR